MNLEVMKNENIVLNNDLLNDEMVEWMRYVNLTFIIILLFFFYL